MQYQKDMTNLYTELYASCQNLDKWRKTFNGGAFGYGLDELSPKKAFHYPEAYAMFAAGYINLAKVSDQGDYYLDLAKKCLRWLIDNKSQNFRAYCWGKPWKNGAVPANEPQTVQTVFCAQAFLEFFKYSSEKWCISIINNIVEWMYSLYHSDNENRLYYFWYSPHEANKRFIPNATAEALGFLAEASQYVPDSNISLDTVTKSAQYLIRMQNEDGSWFYSARLPKIDNVHTAYTLEGLWKYYNATLDHQILAALKTGTEFYMKQFYRDDEYGREQILSGIRDLGKTPLRKVIYDYYARIRELSSVLKFGDIPTRCWGYGSGIRALVSSSRIDPQNIDKALMLANYAISHLQDNSGYFYYRLTDKSYYIRHQADMFYSLTLLLSHLYRRR